MGEFTCFYCGSLKDASESSDEHIVPSCIGGSRNVTLTDRVCKKCNSFMGDNVGLPFCRDWFIESARMLAGVAHRGKRPTTFMGELIWDRPEKTGVFLLEGGAYIFVIDGRDGVRRLAVGLDHTKPEMMDLVRRVIRRKFPGLPIINDASLHSAYELELANAVIAEGASLRIKNQISVVAWHREIAKMALGLACLTLDATYVSSPGAALLREFLHENDSRKRERSLLRGQAGVGQEDSASPLTQLVRPGGDEHLLALISVGDKVAFSALLFGRYENTVEVDATGIFHHLLPGTAIKGVCWIVDPEAKTTNGPLPIEERIVRRPAPA